jgi:hypothetical protein
MCKYGDRILIIIYNKGHWTGMSIKQKQNEKKTSSHNFTAPSCTLPYPAIFFQGTGAARHITPGPFGVALIFYAHARDHQRILGNGRTSATLAVRVNLTAASTWKMKWKWDE